MPPSSIETRSSWSADCFTSCLPIGVEPVKVSLRSRESPISGSITSEVLGGGDDVEHAVGGTPTSVSRSASASIVSGVCDAGLTTIVQPAARAGPILRVPMASGKFHGVIISTGPTGCFIVISRVLPSGEVDQRPAIRTTSSENHRKNSAP